MRYVSKDEVKFTVYGSPVAQPRTKSQGVITKEGRIFAHTYEPGKKDSPARQWKSDVKKSAEPLMPSEPWSGPIALQVQMYFPRPKNLYRKKDRDGSILHCAMPDTDNCLKAIADALSGLFFHNDKQICMMSGLKLYHEKAGRPRADILICQLVEAEPDQTEMKVGEGLVSEMLF